MVVPEVSDMRLFFAEGFFSRDCNFLFWLRILFAKARIFLSFQFSQVGVYVACNLIFIL
jgi:hypothetical protein